MVPLSFCCGGVGCHSEFVAESFHTNTMKTWDICSMSGPEAQPYICVSVYVFQNNLFTINHCKI